MIRYILCQGIGGFTAGSVMFVPTLGFATGAAPVVPAVPSQFLLLGIGD